MRISSTPSRWVRLNAPLVIRRLRDFRGKFLAYPAAPVTTAFLPASLPVISVGTEPIVSVGCEGVVCGCGDVGVQVAMRRTDELGS